MNPTYVIAEAGVNHNGSLELAKRLVAAAAAAGADAVKFQAFDAARLTTAAASKARYQQTNTGSAGSQIEMLRDLQLGADAFSELAACCTEHGVEFLATPFDGDSLQMLVERAGMRRLKMASGELTNLPLLYQAAGYRLPLIISTGMATLGEIEQALAAVGAALVGESPRAQLIRSGIATAPMRAALAEMVTLLQCTSEYPTPPEEVNLRSMDTLAAAFGLPVGLSDHTAGVSAAVAAVARGACVVEKHFTLDRSLPGPDHPASLEPDQLGELVSAIREVERCLGSPFKGPTDAERETSALVRKSLVATRSVRRGEPWNTSNLSAKRPGGGLEPVWYWDLLGRTAQRDYLADEPLGPWELD